MMYTLVLMSFQVTIILTDYESYSIVLLEEISLLY